MHRARAQGDGGDPPPHRRRQGGPDACLIPPWLVRIDVTLEPREVNGQPGAIFRARGNKVLFTLTLDVLDGQIQTIRSVSNPDKLRHVGFGGGRLGDRPRSGPGRAGTRIDRKSSTTSGRGSAGPGAAGPGRPRAGFLTGGCPGRPGQRWVMTVVTGSPNRRSACRGRSAPSQRENGWGRVATMISSNW